MAKEGNYGSGQVALADERNAQVFDSVALFGLLAMAHRQAEVLHHRLTRKLYQN